MSTSIQADYTLVSWLDEAESALTSDFFLVSQYDADTDEMISKKLPYSKLCTLVLNGIDDRVSATCSAYIEDLSVKIDTLSIGLSSTSCLLDDTVSAVIKMANCIQVNKSNISAISGFLLNNIVGENGISVIRPADLSSNSKLKIGHLKSITAASTGLYKLGYDKHGHISSKANVTSSDILGLGNIISGAGEGLVADYSKRILKLSAATATTLGGIKVGDNLSITDGKLSARDTTYGPATASKIGLVKPGDNLAVAADGTLSARDTTYTVGQGLTMSGTKISLSSAGASMLGGIKVGATKDTQKRIYPVTLSAGHAYVSVDWISGNVDDFVATLHNNTLSTQDKTYAVTAIRQQDGNVIALSSSNYVYTKLTELSTKVDGIDTSTAVKPRNGVFIPNNNTVTLYAAPNAAAANNANKVDDFDINPYVVSGEYTNTKYVERGDGRIVTTVGDYLKFAYNYVDDPTPVTSAFYVDLEPVLSHDQFVQSAWYVSSEHTIVIEFKDASKDKLSIDIGDMINVYGREGDVAYLTPNDGIKNQTILRSDVYVCESDDDVSRSMSEEMSMKEVFNSWIKGGAYNGKYYGYDEDYATNVKTIGDWLSYNIATYAQPQEFSQLKNATKEEMGTWSWPATSGSDRPLGNLVGYPYWFYNDTVSSIIQAANTIDTAWYISPIPYTKYDITVRCRAYGTDDDIVGIVIASIPSANGKPKNLNFCRSPNNANTEGYQPACHAYIRSYNVWAGADDVASSFNVRQLSSEFYANMTVHQSRFTAANGNYSPMPDPDKPAYYPIWQNENNNWQWRSSDIRGFWNSHPTPYESKYHESLYKVVPQNVEIGSQPLTGWALKSPNERIDIDNLSSPENWWWMNSGQNTAHYAKCTKNFGWHNAGISYLRVKRNGDHISCWTTKFTGNVNNLDDVISSANRDFNGPTAVPDGDIGWNAAVASNNAFLMTLDLASNVNVPGGGKLSDWGLANNPDGGRIGFVTASQTGASWDIIKMDIPRTIVKTQTNEVIMYDPITGSDISQTTLGTDFCGIGRICKNLATDKSFYVTANNTFLKLAETTEAEAVIDNETIKEIVSNTTIENYPAWIQMLEFDEEQVAYQAASTGDSNYHGCSYTAESDCYVRCDGSANSFDASDFSTDSTAYVVVGYTTGMAVPFKKSTATAVSTNTFSQIYPLKAGKTIRFELWRSSSGSSRNSGYRRITLLKRRS